MSLLRTIVVAVCVSCRRLMLLSNDTLGHSRFLLTLPDCMHDPVGLPASLQRYATPRS